MAPSVSGKVAFVTGGASGIGAALVTALADRGAEVWIADRQLDAAQQLAHTFRPMAPETFAERALRAVLRGDALVVLSAWWKALWYLDRLSPTVSTHLARFTLRRIRAMSSAASSPFPVHEEGKPR